MSFLPRAAGALVPVTVLALVLATGSAAAAHETDQFTVPPGREFADLSDYFTRWAYRAVEGGVKATNSKIKNASDAGWHDAARELSESPDEIAANVNRQFPIALVLIEYLDVKVQSSSWKSRHPGRVVGYKPMIGVRKHAESLLDPFRAWNCATIRAYDVWFGTDKIGHFTDMGMHYFRAYRKGILAGDTDEAAMREPLRMGTRDFIMSERGLLGWKTASAYSNADLMANYMGMMFYRNLTEPVMLHGQIRPPMLEKDGLYWKLSDRVRPDSGFFALFFSDHWDEALNPSWYLPGMRPGIRKSIRDHAAATLDRYADANGNRRSREWFEQKQRELSTYWGVNYGHDGPEHELLSIARTCFPSQPPDESNGRDTLGQTALHHAAMRGDLDAINRLLDAGANVNVQVRSGESRSAEWGNTPLHLAARDGRIDAIRLLLERGAHVNARNDRGVTPLHRAINEPQVAETLMGAGADPCVADARGQTSIHWAALDGDAVALAAMLEVAGDRRLADRDGRTPLHVAAEAGNLLAARTLIRHGAEVDAADNFGVTPLHLAAAAPTAFVTEALLVAGAEPTRADTFGYTPLHAASKRGNTQIVVMLLAHGAEPAASDTYGVTALHLASRYNHIDVAARLLNVGADALARSDTRGTPVDEARRAGNGRLLAMLRTGTGAQLATSAEPAAE